MSFEQSEPYVPATGVYLFRNAAGKTMMDLINGPYICLYSYICDLTLK